MASQPASNPFTHIPGLSKEELARRYTQWAEQQKYEHDLREEVYKGPAIVADVMINLFPEEKSRKDIYILDVAAGTGFVAEKLIQEGFEKFDALEPSEGLLNLAIAKGIYLKTFQTFITDTPTDIESGKLVQLTKIGRNPVTCLLVLRANIIAFSNSNNRQVHTWNLQRKIRPRNTWRRDLDAEGYYVGTVGETRSEPRRLKEAGGHVVIVMSETFLTSVLEYKDRLEPRMKRLEEEGKWVSIRFCGLHLVISIEIKYFFDHMEITNAIVNKLREGRQFHKLSDMAKPPENYYKYWFKHAKKSGQLGFITRELNTLSN
uniref:Methyltransferase domain-containing protein n=1 Tax=Biomphalaria glabrata TaxID=6526 RepID=A0A2C9LUY1_BIOGL